MKSREKTARNSAPGLRLTALTVEDAALLLSKGAGRPITRDMLREDIEAGAPVNADGTINLVHYAAWLVREITKAGPVTAKPEAKTDGD